jgi:hypothetical protein
MLTATTGSAHMKKQDKAMPNRSKGRRVPAAPAPSAPTPRSSLPATDNTRQAYYRAGGPPKACPACGGKLNQHPLDYLIATRSGKGQADSFMLGAEGHVCRRCAAVVIDPEYISKFLQVQIPRWKVGNEFTILGLADLDAIPEDKQDMPLGSDDSPLPLIRLTFPEEQ